MLCSRRIFVVSGGLDVFLLLMGLIGLIMIGPVKLIFPIGALYVWKWWVFPMLVALYGLVATLIAGSFGVRIVIYNASDETFNKLLANVFLRIEKQELESNSNHYMVSGNSVIIPSLGIQFYYEVQRWSRCVILRPTTKDQNPANWLYMERILMETSDTIKLRTIPRIGPILLICSAILWIVSAYHCVPAYHELVAMLLD